MKSNFPSRRSVVMGFGGAVATSQPLAAMAGMRILLQGGNAADAAVATAAALNVVEPMSTGMGGDAFALIYQAQDRHVYALNASGRAPHAATAEMLQRRGLRQVPLRGMLPVTVPGAVAGWADTVSRFGRLGLDTVLAPAIAYAEEGFPVSERISASWQGAEELLQRDPEAARTYLLGERAPRPGERFCSPDLAKSLRLLAKEGPDAFYRGAIADAIVTTSERRGGLLTHRDLAEHTSTWEEPISTLYRGYRVHECAPNGQGIAALIALNILNEYDLAKMGYASADAFHVKMEALKLGMTDAARYVADPQHADVPVQGLLSAEFAEQRRALIAMDRAIAEPQAGIPPTSHDTVYLCAADSEGNAVSFINSLYMGFGSGIVAEGTGIALQNRGNLFTLDPEHPNCIAPGKRPYHTIIPAMVTQDDNTEAESDDRSGRLYLCYGVMGGFMQPQGHVQVLSNIVDHGMDIQRALDAPRFCFQGGQEFLIERWLPAEVYDALRARGHELGIRSGGNFGGGQGILIHPESGALMAGSEPRNDGCAVAF
jgi:gamma-glutamyltranspeptidase / glutathione hydrolase